MSAELELQFKKAKEDFDRAIDHLHKELSKVRTGKASTSVLDGILVNYYGSPVPITQVANLSLSDSRTIAIQPWEKKIIGDIEQAIFASNLGLTPQNDGELIRISIPPLTEERRKEYVKQIKHYGEEAKVSVRATRHKILDTIKKEQKNGLAEDIAKRKEQEIQNSVNDYSSKIDKIVELKDKEIMTV
ncbi:MAG: ribosome recycling factor [Saprospiraceae bacterium]|nr:ribosome recycling factor [Saprospiraceae bacterium]MBK8450395.1 ribosome recycling factor [Saprospiraceae bacterium]MBK8485526.1 ribosome recycling factor [Saprospiraceae bacterium]MBK9222752.1 ribosome recycling factor [Saprospiraceae bacterium]MBK9720204.1 ribosome recycling factor [Saprospiraceae bacterium]